MSDETAPIEKRDIPSLLLDVVESFSPEAQQAAFRKARELSFDLNKGELPFDETLINLSQNRDVLREGIKAGKIPQLPLKIQKALLSEAKKTSIHLTALANGTDAVLQLENAVEDLTATVWESNLQLLSGEILGLQTKQNQLKALEASLRNLTRRAEEFGVIETRVGQSVTLIEGIAQNSEAAGKGIAESRSSAESLVAAITDLEQKALASSNSVQQYEKSVTDSSASTKLIAADVEAASNRSKQVLTDLEALKIEYSGIRDQISAFKLAVEEEMKANVASQVLNFSTLDARSKTEIETLQKSIDENFQALSLSTTTTVTSTIALLKAEAETITTTLQAAEQLRQEKAQNQLKTNTDFFLKSATELEALYKSQADKAVSRSEDTITTNDVEAKRLTVELDALESLIREKIQLATNYQLFHSFQTRQLAIAKGKMFWVWALAACVCVSIALSAWLILYLPYVKVFNVAFYMKLSISLPIIFAITFCSLQYSHERHLEEEYAFKSNISISLDPYRKLVGDLIDSTNPEEKAKYTAFIISSIDKVFTSPLSEPGAQNPSENATAVEKILKALGSVVDPVTKILKK